MEGGCVMGSASTSFLDDFFGEPARMMVSSSGTGSAVDETESRFGSVGGSGSTVCGSELLPSSAQKASKTSWHLPHCTWPWAALSCAELTRNLVLQFGQAVCMSVGFPGHHETQPIFALGGLKIAEVRGVGRAQLRLLFGQDTGEHQPPARLQAPGEARRQLLQGPGEDVGQEQV